MGGPAGLIPASIGEGPGRSLFEFIGKEFLKMANTKQARKRVRQIVARNMHLSVDNYGFPGPRYAVGSFRS